MSENEKKESFSAEFIVNESGSLRIKGNYILTDSEGNNLKTKDEVFICRCGHSKKKPFCDGTHRHTGLKK